MRGPGTSRWRRPARRARMSSSSAASWRQRRTARFGLKQGVGTSSEAMTSWLSTHPALDATTPRPVTLGAATGSYVDVQLAADWNQTCPNGLGLVTGQPDDPQSWSISGPRRMRLYVLDLPSGDTVTIVIDPHSRASFQRRDRRERRRSWSRSASSSERGIQASARPRPPAGMHRRSRSPGNDGTGSTGPGRRKHETTAFDGHW